MAAIHLLALVGIATSLDGAALAIAAAGVALSGMWCAANAMLWLPGCVRRFEVLSDGSASWTDHKGARHDVDLVKVSWCSQFLIILGFRRRGLPWRWLILAQDSAGPEELRNLRVWARWRPE